MDDPYLPPPPLETQPRLVLWRVVLVVSIPVVLVIWVTWTLLTHAQTMRETVKPQDPMTAHDADQPVTLPASLKLQPSYLGVNREPPPPAPPVVASMEPPSAASPVTMGPMVALGTPPEPPPLTHLTGTPSVAAPAAGPPPSPPARGVPPRTGTPPAGAAAPPRAPTPAARWMQPQVVVLASPFATGSQHGSTGGQAGQGHSFSQKEGLIKETVIETPADVLRTLYRSQVITGVLMDAVSSETPGQVRTLVTAPVMDMLGQRQVLIPQQAIILAVQADKATFGQNRLPMRDLVVIFPDGRVVALEKSQLADAAGAAGIKTHVNNHYGTLLLAAGISALLNIGSRGAVGNSSDNQPTFQQDIVQDLGQSITQNAQSVVKRQLEVPPTLEAPAGTPVTIQLLQNYHLVQ